MCGASLVGPPWEVQAKRLRSVLSTVEVKHLPQTTRVVGPGLWQRVEDTSKHAIDCTKVQ